MSRNLTGAGQRRWGMRAQRRSGSCAASFAIRHGGCPVRASGGLGYAPAAGTTGEAAFLLLSGFRWGVHQAEDLVHRLTSIRVARCEPALAIVRTALSVAAPVQALAWVFRHAKVHAQHPPSSALIDNLRGIAPQSAPSLFAAIIPGISVCRKVAAGIGDWRDDAPGCLRDVFGVQYGGAYHLRARIRVRMTS